MKLQKAGGHDALGLITSLLQTANKRRRAIS